MGGHALLIEDDADIREILAEFMEHLGWEIHAASGLAEAERALDRMRPSFALVDWSLEDGTGADAIALLRRRAPHCRVVLATGHGQQLTQEAESTVLAILRKPYPLSALGRILEDLDRG